MPLQRCLSHLLGAERIRLTTKRSEEEAKKSQNQFQIRETMRSEAISGRIAQSMSCDFAEETWAFRHPDHIAAPPKPLAPLCFAQIIPVQ